jgi:hypothetical protein
MKKNILQYIIYIFLLIFSIIVVFTGFLKFPGLLNIFNINNFAIPLGLFTVLHDWVGVALTALSILHILINWKWIQGMTKKIFGKKMIVLLFWIVAFAVLSILVSFISLSKNNTINTDAQQIEPTITRELEDYDFIDQLDETLPVEVNQINIDEIGTFSFDPSKIDSIRTDIFKQGYFSIFDILVFLDATDQIKMEYEFSEELQTYIIIEINGIGNWWYQAYYDGGWPERNVWRMDLYPYKDKTTIQIFQIDELSLFNIYDVFSKDTQRKKLLLDKFEIPKIIIRGIDSELIFEKIEIEPHNLRKDYFVEDSITAIDAILTLGDLGLISNSIKWYESIGTAGVVKNYFVNEINGEKSAGRCGFVYEIGEKEFLGFRGNHIHIPSDLRIIDTIPEYIEYFWICI